MNDAFNSIARVLSSVANQYYPYNLLYWNFAKTLFILNKIQPNRVKQLDSWKGEDIVVPLAKTRSSSVMMGGYTADADITQLTGMKGFVKNQAAITGSVKFFHRDIIERSGLRTKTFINSLRQEMDVIVDMMAQTMSLQMGTGPYFAEATAAGGTDGSVAVDKIYAFQPDQLVVAASKKGTTGPIAPKRYWVTKLDLQNKKVFFATTKGGTPGTLAAWTTAKAIVFFHNVADISTIDKVQDAMFHSIKGVVLNSANGGSSKIYGLDKGDHHILNPINLSGSNTVNYSNGSEKHLLKQIFVASKELSQRGVRFAKTAVMDLELYTVCKNILNREKNTYTLISGTSVSDQYAWHSMKVHATTGDIIDIVGVREWMPNTVFFLDFFTWDLHTNGGIVPVNSLEDGIQFNKVRKTDGIYYIADFECFGQLVCNHPLANSVLTSIPATVREDL